ncbi:MAG TPA: 2-phospho-L-lactate transferase [Phototrophicaceae bacterium]|jgi:LPPG:FO 2-phospho-L-lactate transferase|nr:2-phospho-L-lactate transferase [Phototrophicaceae bacterium]
MDQSDAISPTLRVTVLVGGVGGAKLAYGLAQIVPPENLTIIVNVGDDFWHYGLKVCPDSDTIMYTLSGLVDPVNGWGLSGDTTNMLEMIRKYDEEPWFGLKDRDLATHLLRTQMLHQGQRLTEVTQFLSQRLGIRCALLPVTDQEVSTMVDTVEHGELEFQTYFVRHRWQPRVKSIRYRGIEAAKLTPEVEQAITTADIILFGPSNPWLSIEPILAIPGLRDLIQSRAVPRAAVTPIIAGQAVKGPAAKMMQELGYEVSPASVADFYGDTINTFIIDDKDLNLRTLNLRTLNFDTMMNNDGDKIRLARQVLTTLG